MMSGEAKRTFAEFFLVVFPLYLLLACDLFFSCLRCRTSCWPSPNSPFRGTHPLVFLALLSCRHPQVLNVENS